MDAAPLPCTPWVRHLREHLPIAAAGEDPEGVHQLRVAAAHLRVWLRLAQLEVLDDDLRWLRHAAGEVRDLDVLLALVARVAQGGAPDYLTDLEERWITARRALLAALAAPRTAALLGALEALPPAERGLAVARTGRWQRRVLKLGKRLDWTGAPEAELHAFRRRVRRLRYAREWIERPSDPIKGLAERLGKLNDLFLLRRRLEDGDLPAGQAPSLDELTGKIERKRARLGQRWPEFAQGLDRE